MRRIKLIVVIALFVSLCLGITAFALNDGASDGKMWFQSKEKTDAYIFPITPKENPEKWEKFQSLSEMIDICQVPEEKLKNMSAEGLIETCLSYPMFGNVMLHNSPYNGFLKQIERFNGLKELLNRDDVASAICNLYYNVSLDKVLKTDDYPTYRLRYLEYIISQPEILKQLDDKQMQELLSYALRLANTKIEKYSGVFTVAPTALIIGRIMSEDEKCKEIIENNKSIKRFLESGIDFTNETWNEMMPLLQESSIGGLLK